VSGHAARMRTLTQAFSAERTSGLEVGVYLTVMLPALSGATDPLS
jgi:hypothetical protein